MSPEALRPNVQLDVRLDRGLLERSGTLVTIDSHTGGEPTRLVIDGGPDLGRGSLAERRAILAGRHDWLRTAVVNEPRGSEVLVGGLVVEPCDPTCAAGVIFFNTVGYLGMCGHGTIGLAATLAAIGRLDVGTHRVETPVGIVTVTWHGDGRASIRNVPSHRSREDVTVEVPGIGAVTGDIAYGGNWFFLIGEHGQSLEFDRCDELTAYTRRIMHALDQQSITGDEGAKIDHIELFAPSSTPGVDSRNFVLCPGAAYDRSPCGTGTSAKVACLAADGALKPGEPWVQESIVGSTFTATYELDNGRVVPTITGSAFVNAISTLIIDPHDPFRHGLTGPGV